MTKNCLLNFREEKAIAVASLLLKLSNNKCDKYWLNKVMYYVERQSLVLTGQPVFYDSLYSVKYGPIVSAVNDAIDNTAYPFDNEWNKHLVIEGNTVKLKIESNYSSLSDFEVKIVEDAYNKFKGWSFSQLKEFFHNLPEHKETISRIDIEYSEILKYSGADEESIQDALETISYFKNLESSFHCGE
jgi:uncharacterized phage-associated protein